MQKRKTGDYKYFHTRLEIDFKKFPPHSKEELKLQMLTLGYRVDKKLKEKIEPSDLQLTHAWDWLRKEGYIKKGQQEIIPKKEKKMSDYYTIKMIGTRRNYHATEGRMIYSPKTKDLKFYRKGQFIPKQR
jgi:hypothetical protein